MDRDYTQYKNAEDMVNKTGLPVDECLKIVEIELTKFQRLKQ